MEQPISTDAETINAALELHIRGRIKGVYVSDDTPGVHQVINDAVQEGDITYAPTWIGMKQVTSAKILK